MVNRTSSTGTPAGWAPFRVAILAELQPQKDAALRCPLRLKPEEVTIGSYDRLLGRVEPAFRMILTDPTSMKDIEVDVRWKSWADVLGAGLVASPSIVAMSDARSSLMRGSSKQDPYQFVDRVLPGNEAWLPRSPTPDAGKSEAAKGPASKADGDPLGALLDLVDLPSQSPSSQIPSSPSPGRYTAAGTVVESAMSALACQALAHPEYQRLRRVWQSLRFLLEAQGNSKAVEFCLIDSSADLDQLSKSLDQIDADLLVVEAPFEACPRDSERLNFLANWASDLSVTVIATLDASWFTRPAPTAPTPKLSLTEPARALLDTIARREPARWLVLTTNDLCECEPISGSIAPGAGSRGGPSCAQPRDLETSWTFLPAGVAVAHMVVGSLVNQGEPFISDAWGSDQLRSNALYEMNSIVGPVAIGTRWFCTADNATELGYLGISALVPEKNRDRVRLTCCPSAFRPRDNGGYLARPASTLHDQLLAGKVVRLLTTGRATGFGADDLNEVAERLRDAIRSLFPKATPRGPFVDVTAHNGSLEIGIEPRNYGQLTLEQLNLSVPLR